MSINSNEIIKKPDVVIDPNFFLPPGVVDARYPNGDETQDQNEEIIETDLSPVDLPELTDEEPIDNATPILLPPDDVVVVSQIIRTLENGQQVVDVILEVQDVEESIQVDVRLAKS